MADLTFKDLQQFENFGHSLSAPSYYYQPSEVDQLQQILNLAHQHGLKVTLRGAGRSYNDAALNGGGLLLDLQALNRILDWQPETGVIRCEPGVTIQQLWQHVLPDGWWPPVVSGTMTTTLGGCLGMNIHGKNNYRAGTIGDHVESFTALLTTGAQITCTPALNGDLFRAMIGGLGMLGIFTSITLKMKKVYSGLLQVEASNVPDLAAQLDFLETRKDTADYLVGWVDCLARGTGLGRGQMHAASYLPEGVDPQVARDIQVDFQMLPKHFFGVFPKSSLHYFMAPFMNNLGVRLVNTAKHLVDRNKTFRQTHAAFHFLMDYIPDWERSYGKRGLIQHQSFLSRENALSVWTEMLRLAQKRHLPSYLGVSKRHRADGFLLSHALDGFSLAMDFKVTRANAQALTNLLQDFDRLVLQAGGRFYFAKNSETLPESAEQFLGPETIRKFQALKKRCDPDGLLGSDLYRRVFGPL